VGCPLLIAEPPIHESEHIMNADKKAGEGFVNWPQKDGKSLRVPYKDADLPQHLVCMPKDIAKAVCNDPTNCVMALMLRREFGASLVEARVLRTTAHVLIKKYGKLQSIRFDVKGRLLKAIQQFDRSEGGSGFLPGETYTLYPPVPSDVRGARAKSKGKGNGKQTIGINRIAPVHPSRATFCMRPLPIEV
jgi:hypothetical protein